jgi:hypothetical protein
VPKFGQPSQKTYTLVLIVLVLMCTSFSSPSRRSDPLGRLADRSLVRQMHVQMPAALVSHDIWTMRWSPNTSQGREPGLGTLATQLIDAVLHTAEHTASNGGLRFAVPALIPKPKYNDCITFDNFT